MSSSQDDRHDYWNEHYGKQVAAISMTPPSQFAAFVMSEIPRGTTVFDVGCGNARDSIFFGHYGFDVLGFDQSEAAVDVANKTAKAHGLSNVAFQVCDIDGPEIYGALEARAATPKCVYARFFLHAITQAEQDYMLAALAKSLAPGDIVAFEFRTDDDEDVAKVMGNTHFRRYQSGEDVNAALTAHGFEEIYSIAGRGFSKYKFEDAAVARCIFKR